jgi:hypothetical protein
VGLRVHWTGRGPCRRTGRDPTGATPECGGPRGGAGTQL